MMAKKKGASYHKTVAHQKRERDGCVCSFMEQGGCALRQNLETAPSAIKPGTAQSPFSVYSRSNPSSHGLLEDILN